MGFLPAVFGDALGKIAFGIEQADSHERQSQVAGFFGMVARQHTQAAGVNRQRLVQAELHRKIGDQLVAQLRMGLGKPGMLGLHILVEERIMRS